MRNREEVLNVRLSDVLRAHGADTSPETIQRRGKERPDITLGLFRGMRVVIEGKLADDTQARKNVQSDAQGRIDSGIAQLVVAVVYPVALREQVDSGLVAELQKATLDFTVLSETGQSPWRRGTAADILSELRRANVRTLSSEHLDGLALAYENLKNPSMQPFKAMAHDPTRAAIDAAIAKAFGLELTSLREALANEAIVCGEPRARGAEADPESFDSQSVFVFE